MKKGNRVKLKNGKVVIFVHNINPWEFRAHYPNSQFLQFTFGFSEIKREVNNGKDS